MFADGAGQGSIAECRPFRVPVARLAPAQATIG